MRCLILFILLLGCNPVRQVLRSPEKTQAVVSKYLGNLPPVRNDTVRLLLPGRSDTAINTVFDTLYVPGDTVYVYVTKTKVVTINKTDTIKTIETDRKLIREWQDKATSEATAKDQWKSEAQDNAKNRDKWKLNFWLAMAAIGIAALITFIIKIKT